MAAGSRYWKISKYTELLNDKKLIVHESLRFCFRLPVCYGSHGTQTYTHTLVGNLFQIFTSQFFDTSASIKRNYQSYLWHINWHVVTFVTCFSLCCSFTVAIHQCKKPAATTTNIYFQTKQKNLWPLKSIHFVLRWL